MSELKEHLFCECDECIREYRGPLSNEMRPYYLKSEADKVIARHKYKRCLAMANFCFTKSLFLRYALADRIQNGENYISANYWRINLYEKWCERLKKLAEKFKEAK